MEQLQKLNKYEEKIVQTSDSNRFFTCEKIVDELVSCGVPNNLVPNIFINDVSKKYGINKEEARTCIKLAIKQLETENSDKETKPKEKLYGECGYYYPTINVAKENKKNDGMDSLSSLGQYKRLMFQIH